MDVVLISAEAVLPQNVTDDSITANGFATWLEAGQNIWGFLFWIYPCVPFKSKGAKLGVSSWVFTFRAICRLYEAWLAIRTSSCTWSHSISESAGLKERGEGEPGCDAGEASARAAGAGFRCRGTGAVCRRHSSRPLTNLQAPTFSLQLQAHPQSAVWGKLSTCRPASAATRSELRWDLPHLFPFLTLINRFSKPTYFLQ